VTPDADDPAQAGEPRDLETLRARWRAGWRAGLVPFWGHTPSGARLGAECLSQWYPAAFTVDGERYATAEPFMMAAKARLFGDETCARRVLTASSPRAAKALGREVRGFDEATWVARRFDLVVAGNQAKFAQSPALARFLVATRGKVLVEASPLDRVWGVGLAAADPRLADPGTWLGLNLLGFALMVVRPRLAAAP